jgi:LPXTG-motif cell wall-anchored protein
MQLKPTAVLISALMLSAGAALAAHKYDSNKPLTLNGTVTKVEWQKPYVKIHMDAKDASGKTVDWEIETAEPSVMESDGITRSSINKGDQITVQGDGAASGSPHALAHSLRLANGRTMSLSQSQAEVNPASPSAPAPPATSDSKLPRTASNMPLVGLIGLVTLGAGAVLSMRRRLSQ